MAKITGIDLIHPREIDAFLKANAKARAEAQGWLDSNPAATAEERKARLAGLKVRRLYDGGGLFLLDLAIVDDLGRINTQAPAWRFEYRYRGVDKLMSLGTLARVSLKVARELAVPLRDRVGLGGNPAGEDKAKRTQEQAAQERKVEDARCLKAGEPLKGSVLHVYRSLKASKVLHKAWGTRNVEEMDAFMARNMLPLADKRIAHVTEDDLRAVLAPYTANAQIPTAARMLSLASMIYTHARTDRDCQDAIAPDLNGARLHNIALDLQKGFLPAHRTKSHAQLKDQNRIGDLVNACRNADSRPIMAAALLCQLTLFQRPANTCAMRWADIDRDNQVWRIPMPEMKVPEAVKQDKSMAPHHVPLPWQIIKLLDELRPLTGHLEYVFVARLSTRKPITPTTMLTALREMKFGADEICAHGMRGTAFSSILNHIGGGKETLDAIEANMAHVYGGPQGNTYNQAEYVAKRHDVLQAWADHLDRVASGEWQKAQDEALAKRRAELDAKINNVVPLRKAA